MNTKTFGLFPGSFKPPHKGHFNAIKEAALSMDGWLFVIISPKSRIDSVSEQPSTLEDALAVWEIYQEHLPKNVQIVTAKHSPVTTVYQTILRLNDRTVVVEDSVELITEQIRTNPKQTAIVFASDDDLERFGRLKSTPQISIVVNPVEAFNFGDVKISSSNLRHLIATKHTHEVLKFMPEELSIKQRKQVLRIWGF
jgi:nicotinic acid mononucleotide adenylyltransferase